jgi:hypothetical protein
MALSIDAILWLSPSASRHSELAGDRLGFPEPSPQAPSSLRVWAAVKKPMTKGIGFLRVHMANPRLRVVALTTKIEQTC